MKPIKRRKRAAYVRGFNIEPDIVFEDRRWQDLEFQDLVTRAISGVLAHLGLSSEAVEITVLACDDTRICALNSEFRDKATPTNVLSWPCNDLSPEIAGAFPLPPQADVTGSMALGDIALSYDTCLREAEAAAKSMDNHVLHLIVHGTLHLLGFDHIRDPDATLMERIEVEILEKMGVRDPYTVINA